MTIFLPKKVDVNINQNSRVNNYYIWSLKYQNSFEKVDFYTSYLEKFRALLIIILPTKFLLEYANCPKGLRHLEKGDVI